MSGRCKNNPNFFCFVCGLYTPTNQRQPLTNAIHIEYRLFSGRILKNVNQSWEPQFCCPTCAIELIMQRINAKNKQQIDYAVVPSVAKSVFIHVQ